MTLLPSIRSLFRTPTQTSSAHRIGLSESPGPLCTLYLRMTSIDLDTINFYTKPPSKSGPCSDKRPPAHIGCMPTPGEQCEGHQALISTTIPGAYTSWSSDNNIPVSLRVEKDSGAKGWRCDLTPVFKMPPGLSKKPPKGSSSYSTKADRKFASTPSDRAVKGDDCPHLRHPPGTPYKSGILGKPTVGETTCE